jgi:FAD/FMN-containing dehydrogenase
MLGVMTVRDDKIGQLSRLTATLVGVLGRDHVLTDPDLTASYTVDWTGRWRGQAAVVARPASTAEVVAVLQACLAFQVAVVPQGGNTGLVGGGVPADHGSGPDDLRLVMSLVRLGRLDPVDAAAAQVTVGAGVTLAALQRHVAASSTGLAFGVDLGARDSATVGGMVATNAGGIHFVRHGGMRQQVAGLEVVLADGQVVERLRGPAKDNTGYDVPGLLVGSEGTLGIVTAARLRLVAALPFRVTALIGVAGTAAAIELVTALRRHVPALEAAEIFYQEGLELVCRTAGLVSPLGSPLAGRWRAYLLVECAGADDTVTDQLAQCLATAGVDDEATAVATTPKGRQNLWAIREGHTEAVNRLGVPHKLDVSLPLGALASFVPAVHQAVAGAASDATVVLWGHAGDGNLHVNVVGPAPDDYTVDDAVYRLVAEMGGSISAEHGIGRAKIPWLHLTRSGADIGAMRAIKQALDPTGRLNPGVLLPPEELLG